MCRCVQWRVPGRRHHLRRYELSITHRCMLHRINRRVRRSGRGSVRGGRRVHDPDASCATVVCFPIGACCLSDGSCVPEVAPDICEAGGGVFQGNATACTDALCPQPLGACCLENGNCFVVEEDVCPAFAGSWKSNGTFCEDDGICDEALSGRCQW